MHRTNTMNQTSNFFSELATKLETEWAQRAHDLYSFTGIATDALRSLQYTLTRDELDRMLADWMTESSSLPEQINVHNTFGQPPVTIFNNGKFVVDVYFWLGCDTSIHSHGFRGAFKVLHGKSLHETFQVEISKSVADDVALTNLGTPSLELLKSGDVRAINAGTELTHRVIHLEEPTITLCVKTINEPALSQWHHFSEIPGIGGLAVQKRHLDSGLIKKVYYFQYLMSQNEASASTFLKRFVEKQDRSTLMNLCEEVASGGYELSDEIAQRFLDEVYARFADEEWFQRYEASAAAMEGEIVFAQSPSPLTRLAAHFVNTHRRFSDVEATLNELAEKHVSKKEIEELILSVVDSENSHGDLQLSRMRAFLEG